MFCDHCATQMQYVILIIEQCFLVIVLHESNYNTLVTWNQPYLFATIFKHFIYVCFQLLIFMNENQLKLH